MLVDLPDDSKQELSDALKEVGAAANKLRRCLTVQLEGYGRYDSAAARRAAEKYQHAVEEAAAISGESVAPMGLFNEPDRERSR